jgi:hypothetical protein
MTISAAAEIAVDLQWPLNLDLDGAMRCLAQSFASCRQVSMEGRRVEGIQNSMARQAKSYARAYCALRASQTDFDGDHDPVMISHFFDREEPIFEKAPDLELDFKDPLTINLALHIIPSLKLHEKSGSLRSLEHFLSQFQREKSPPEKTPPLGQSGFASYLCCINSFLGPVDPRLVAQRNKR